jgi:light-regulated signal transduction histidine kinase (bacteriophytochrome)
LNNSEHLLETLEKKIPDLILLDIVMPGIDGLEICRRLKQDENYRSIPVIFLTAMDDTDSIVRGFEVGAQDYISKSVNPEVLLARVKTHIELKQRTDTLKEAYNEIMEFNHMISHDLKGPLWDIQKLAGYMEEALVSNNRDDEEELLNEINKKAGEAVTLIDRYSQLSKVSSTPLKIEAVDISKLIKNIFKELAVNCHNRDIEFNCSYMPIVFGDRILLTQVFINILSNAFKFTRDRKPAIITIEYQKKGMEHVFVIRDNGVGFDMKYSGKLFGMFQRMHSQEEFEGTGAGLSIVKRIIERHNGRVWIEAEPDKGAALSFTLPIRVS